MNPYSEKARAYFLEGYNCSQSVLLAFHEELHLSPELAARMASSFGGGMGRLREVCGAVSGMFLALGLLDGYSDPQDQDGKKAQYALIQELAEAFREQNHSILCRELLGLDHHSDTPTPSARTAEYYQQRPCADLVADAAEILGEWLINKNCSR
ncbi:MAG: C-GCAxxG-C-C family protein [Lachnospiraceae bacterium]|nr:C-GCAxxG-C-C family protein [Lachnospiraceae bacterium]